MNDDSMLGHDLLATCRALGPGSGVSWSIGECAKAFGLSTATLRAWETRYGLEPSDRSAGGHRRYTCEDLEKLRVMTTLMDRGVPAREAAAFAMESRGVLAADRLDEADLRTRERQDAGSMARPAS